MAQYNSAYACEGQHSLLAGLDCSSFGKFTRQVSVITHEVCGLPPNRIEHPVDCQMMDSPGEDSCSSSVLSAVVNTDVNVLKSWTAQELSSTRVMGHYSMPQKRHEAVILWAVLQRYKYRCALQQSSETARYIA